MTVTHPCGCPRWISRRRRPPPNSEFTVDVCDRFQVALRRDGVHRHVPFIGVPVIAAPARLTADRSWSGKRLPPAGHAPRAEGADRHGPVRRAEGADRHRLVRRAEGADRHRLVRRRPRVDRTARRSPLAGPGGHSPAVRSTSARRDLRMPAWVLVTLPSSIRVWSLLRSWSSWLGTFPSSARWRLLITLIRSWATS